MQMIEECDPSLMFTIPRLAILRYSIAHSRIEILYLNELQSAIAQVNIVVAYECLLQGYSGVDSTTIAILPSVGLIV